jgi:integrase
MSRPRKSIPSYLPHVHGKARAVWTDATGTRRFRMLPGPFNSPESRAAFGRLVAELEARPAGVVADPEGITVNELLLAYVEHADRHYRDPDGNPTGEFHHVRTVCRHVRELYGHSLAAGFGPLAIKAVRQKFVAAGWCRKTVNQQVERLRRAFKWAASEELIPFEVYHRLTAVTGLQKGRTPARESEPVGPVDDAVVDATLPHLNRHVRGLVEFQRLTGCRPGEVCRVRRCDIDTGGPVWLYRPPRHKGSWRGKGRTIAIGPKAQQLLKQFFTPEINDYLFSPARAIEEVRAERSDNRKTPRYPSHMRRNELKRKPSPQRTPADRYNRTSYFNAIARACDRAFPPPGDLARGEGEPATKWWSRLTPEQRVEVKAWRKVHRWSANELRHSYATRVRKQFSLEHAGAALGHARMSVTETYAQRDEQLALVVAQTIG